MFSIVRRYYIHIACVICRIFVVRPRKKKVVEICKRHGHKKVFALRCAQQHEKERSGDHNWLAALFLLDQHQGRMRIEKLQNPRNYEDTRKKVSRMLWIMNIGNLWCEINVYRVLNLYLRLTNRHGLCRRSKWRLTKINSWLYVSTGKKICDKYLVYTRCQ